MTLRYCSDLSGLSFIITIGGNLFIERYSGNNFTGLENLSSLGGDLILSFNSNTDVSQINLTFVMGSVEIAFQRAEITSGFSALDEISGDLTIRNSVGMTSLKVVSNLNYIDGSIEIRSLTNLDTISFPLLDFIGEDFQEISCGNV